MPVKVLVEHRLAAVREATSRQPRIFERIVDGRPAGRISEWFGAHTFSFHRAKDKLPKSVFQRLQASAKGGQPLDRDLADAIAHAVKEWAISLGATHFTHWFQPMTGLTAEKHDAFLTLDAEGQAIERLSGQALLQSEPDASSFPSGGMRTTFEARGYTGWDPSSPMFLMGTPNGLVLCIPSVFLAYNGIALDARTPLLRSMDLLDNAARALLARLGESVGRVVPTLGVEQEYFLVDRAFYSLRPDLAIAGRTILGARPPKGQSMEDHYFGAISPRVQAFMEEVDFELHMLGVPAKTRHNEVAPAQYEIAPIFEEAHVAVDHNQLVMEMLRRVAPRHDFQVVLHEKPFNGVNGSGKHCNWSLLTDQGHNLLEPGDTPQQNLRFLAVLAAVLLGVHRNAAMLRASVATHGNDFRLGAAEAPPAILSVFLGELLTSICEALENDEVLHEDPTDAMLSLGVARLPRIVKDCSDRNRTSPFAFTGNKFEFRAPGASQSPADPVTYLNTAVADGMRQLVEWIDEAEGSNALLQAIRRAIQASNPIRFEGNSYSSEWMEEAENRGLPHFRTATEALRVLRDSPSARRFVDLGVFSTDELLSRHNVGVERYVTQVEIEVDLLRDLVDGMVMPALVEEWGELVGYKPLGLVLNARFVELEALIEELSTATVLLASARAQAEESSDRALAFASTVGPAIQRLRAVVDRVETTISDSRWPLPKYREMLFLR